MFSHQNDTKEVGALREMVEKLQKKCQQQASEIQDLTRESNDQKQELLLLVGQQDCDLKFANSVLGLVLKEADLAKIKQRSVWSEGRKEWSIPAFLLQEKRSECQFPTINGKQRAEQLRDERELKFTQAQAGKEANRTTQGRF